MAQITLWTCGCITHEFTMFTYHRVFQTTPHPLSLLIKASYLSGGDVVNPHIPNVSLFLSFFHSLPGKCASWAPVIPAALSSDHSHVACVALGTHSVEVYCLCIYVTVWCTWLLWRKALLSLCDDSCSYSAVSLVVFLAMLGIVRSDSVFHRILWWSSLK